MLTPQDWRQLRHPILVLGSTLLAIVLLVSFADQYLTNSEIALQQRQHLLDKAVSKYKSSSIEKENIIQFLPMYNDLLRSGFIGEERRIEWIESLRQIHAQHQLFSIDYSIGLQEQFSPSYIPNLGSFTMNRSTMKLNLDMLHEGDLLNLLNGLKVQTALFIVRECEMKRPIGAAINVNNVVANLNATCEIDWLTLRDPLLAEDL